jgi:predicted nicotinamide N-methyase
VSDPAAFVRANTVVSSTTLVPEIALHMASEITPIWRATEDWLATRNIDPPYWAFAWPGGQALARYILDHPDSVAGKRVLDFAAGGGIAAIAAARAGANGVTVATQTADLVGTPCRWDLILCGDVCYEAPMTEHILPWLRAMAAKAEVWLADPGRAYLPSDGRTAFARYTVPTTLELECRMVREATLYRLASA